ncbi:DNA recombination protein RmuC [Brevibacterium samyangense]|uniref:DNA recombination protein RmuC n=1 Tax=Brevibacterium samyangense TaxID=366888 RepID=A0ABP5ENQ7_9MICO
MDLLTLFLVLAVLLIGLAVGFFLGTARTRAALSVELAEARTAERMLGERTAALEADAQLAGEVTAAVGPLAAGVRRLQESLDLQDRHRLEQLTHLDAQITQLARQSHELRESSGKLAGALHSTAARGDWGEVQLRRVVEYAGLLPHVDFDTQVSAVRDGRRVRPDMVVHLPGGGTIVVDAKTPLSAQLRQATGADPDGSGTAGDTSDLDHARALLRHVDALAQKEYWKSFDPAPEFVVCFVPTDGILSTAASAYPHLVDQALGKKVVLASPSTLLVLLKTVALNWRQYDMSSSAKEVLRLGTELHDRTGSLASALTRMGAGLDRTVKEYNTFIGSFENRFLVTARKLRESGIAGDEIPEIGAVDSAPRTPHSPELSA